MVVMDVGTAEVYAMHPTTIEIIKHVASTSRAVQRVEHMHHAWPSGKTYSRVSPH